MKRRLRASRKTLTTLLTANPTTFRALVQQFTGCSKTCMSVRASKGPININFAVGMKHDDYPEHDEYVSIVQPQQKQRAGQNDHHHHHQQEHRLSNQEEEKIWDLSFLDNVNISDLDLPTSCLSASDSPDISQGIVN